MLWGLNHEDYIVFGASVLMFGPVERWGDTCMLNKDKQMKTEVKSKKCREERSTESCHAILETSFNWNVECQDFQLTERGRFLLALSV